MRKCKFTKIGILMGGQTAEREVSLNSGNAVLESLLRSEVNAVGIDVGDDLIERIKSEQIDCAFIALHGGAGEDGTIQGVLEFLKIPYTGSGILASAIAMEKIRCKQMWQAVGLPTPLFSTLTEGFDVQEVIDRIGLPMIVKPSREGSSFGITLVHSAEQLKQAWLDAFEYDRTVLAEKYIEGPELTVGILNGETLPVIQISTPRSFYDYDAKYIEGSTQYRMPSGLSEIKEKELQELALRSFDAVGASNWGRVDAMQDSDGDFWLLEINTIPGLTDHSLVPKAAKAVGIGFDDLILRIIDGVSLE